MSSPSLDGQSRQFVLTSAGGGGERFANYLGTSNLDTTSTEFVYDTWLNVDTTHIGQIELDINQTLADGTTIIFGTQCNLTAGVWDYTSNLAGNAHWNHSTIPCTSSQIPSNTWVHVVITSHRVGGLVTYDSVCVGSTCTNFTNATVNSQFSLGFLPLGNIVVNFQLNGDGASFTSNAYLDETNIYRYSQ